MKHDSFHILWDVNLYLYMDLMEFEINTIQYVHFGVMVSSSGAVPLIIILK
jgi:hypothetical protein